MNYVFLYASFAKRRPKHFASERSLNSLAR